MPRSYSDRLVASQPENVHTITAKDETGRRAYYVLLVAPSRERAFLEALKNRQAITDLENWGKVLASNYGEGPSEATRELLKERYGFDV